MIDFLKSCNLEEYNRSTRLCLSYVGLATLVTFVQFTVMASSLFDMLHGGVAISVIGVIVERLWCYKDMIRRVQAFDCGYLSC